MTEHQEWNQKIPEYVNGTLSINERRAFEKHLAHCEACRRESEEWKSIAGIIRLQNEFQSVNPDLSAKALQSIREQSHTRWRLEYVFSMVRMQIRLIRGELWASAFLILMMGVITAHLFDQFNLYTLIAPLVAAASISTIYGKDSDSGYELLLSAPIARMQILLSRLVLVFGYNLILFILGVFVLRPLQQDPITVHLIGQWLAPMAFLSSLALLLSVSIGASNAVLITYVFWLSSRFLQADYIFPTPPQFFVPLIGLWTQTMPLYILSAVMLLMTLLVIRLPLSVSTKTTI